MICIHEGVGVILYLQCSYQHDGDCKDSHHQLCHGEYVLDITRFEPITIVMRDITSMNICVISYNAVAPDLFFLINRTTLSTDNKVYLYRGFCFKSAHTYHSFRLLLDH